VIIFSDKVLIILSLVLDEQEKRIIWSFDVKKCEQQQLEKLLLKLPKGKYEPLTTIRAEKILNKESFKKDEVCYSFLYVNIYKAIYLFLIQY